MVLALRPLPVRRSDDAELWATCSVSKPVRAPRQQRAQRGEAATKAGGRVLAGPDRILFRGVLRSISYMQGLEIFLASIRVLNRDFMAYAQRISEGPMPTCPDLRPEASTALRIYRFGAGVQRGYRTSDRVA